MTLSRLLPSVPDKGCLVIDQIDHVEQKVVNAETGDCMQACLASLLRIPIEDVPTFHGSNAPAWNWLFQRGLWIKRVIVDCGFAAPPGYGIGTVKSKLFPGKEHAVVVLDGKIVWDPSPSWYPVGEDPRAVQVIEVLLVLFEGPDGS